MVSRRLELYFGDSMTQGKVYMLIEEVTQQDLSVGLNKVEVKQVYSVFGVLLAMYFNKVKWNFGVRGEQSKEGYSCSSCVKF